MSKRPLVKDMVLDQLSSQSIVGQEGVNQSERHLYRLCRKSFLSLWSYADVFRDQGRHSGKGDGKELCDLLVIFGQHIILFSDKDCEFPDSGDLGVDWRRWYKKAVFKSAEQLWGAERWIRSFPNTLYVDHACSRKLPVPLPDMAQAKFHRVLVAHGASHRCKQMLGGSGSLMLASDYVGDNRLFTIGRVDPRKGFIHVFDDTTLDIVLKARDTISDFVEYLSCKEQFLTSGAFISAAGEEDLLAYYLRYTNKQGEHDFVESNGNSLLETYDGICIVEGFWDEFTRNPKRKAQLAEDKISYLWDKLIETFNKHILTDTQYHTIKTSVADAEKIMRFMASEPRLRRRMLARSLAEMVETTPDNLRRTRVWIPTSLDEPYYVFLLLPWMSEHTEEENREVRAKVLEAACLITKLMYPAAQDIIGIATESGYDPNLMRSHDAMYFDARNWTDEMEARAKEDQAQLGLLTNVSMFRGHEQEYPFVPTKNSASSVTMSIIPATRHNLPKRQMPLTHRTRRRFLATTQYTRDDRPSKKRKR